MAQIHREALDYFIKHQEELCEKYNGKELLMQGTRIIGAFDTVHDAAEEGRRLFGAGNFSLRTCIPGKEAYTVELPLKIKKISCTYKNYNCKISETINRWR